MPPALRVPDNPTLRPDGIFMWGDLADVDLVVDLVSFLQHSRRTAVLTVVADEARKSIYFREGSVIAASSNLAEDRFGDIMFRCGMITREQLDQALRKVGPGRKIGNVLFARGLMTSGDLWKIVRLQIEEIFHSVLLLEGGQYTVASFDPSQVPTSTPLETQHLLLEGLRRKDEMAQLREELPPIDRVLVHTGFLTPSTELESAEKAVYDVVDGRRTLAEVFRASGLGEFVATGAIHRLMRTGLVGEAPMVEPGEAGGGGTSVGAIILGYNDAYVRMHGVLANTVRGRSYRKGLSSFFANSGPLIAALFEGVEPASDGRLPSDRIQINLKTMESDDRVRLLRRGLREYLRFLLFVARECMPYEEVEGLKKKLRDQVRGL